MSSRTKIFVGFILGLVGIAQAAPLVGDGNTDDRAAIMTMVDAVRSAREVWDVPDEVYGGIVKLPAGVFYVSAPIEISSGVKLVGEGRGTSIVTDSDTLPAILYKPANPAHIYVSNTELRSIAVVNRGDGPGIRAETGTQWTNNIIDDVYISAGGTQIDLWGSYAQQCAIRNVYMKAIGGPPIAISGNVNLLENIDVKGSVRANYATSDPTHKAHFTIVGNHFTLRNITDEPSFPAGFKCGPSMYLSGENFDVATFWEEVHSPDADGAFFNKLAYVYEHVKGRVASLHHFGYLQRAQIKGDSWVTFNQLNINGDQQTLTMALSVDAPSIVRVGQVMSRYDAGSVDRVRVDEVTHATGGYTLPRPIPIEGATMSRAVGYWTMAADSGVSYTTPRKSDGVLRFTVGAGVAANKSVYVTVPLNVTTGEIAEWFVSGPTGNATQLVVTAAGRELNVRALAGYSAARIPQPGPNSSLVFRFIGIMPGTYELSGVGVFRELKQR